uniref:Uncharacterized protein n=1 Tax=Anguilla anguilla TaxID=7936 RepID=A0A0E9WB00_ANGAN
MATLEKNSDSKVLLWFLSILHITTFHYISLKSDSYIYNELISQVKGTI